MDAASNLSTKQQHIDAFQNLLDKGQTGKTYDALPNAKKPSELHQLAYSENKPLFDYLRMKAGPDSSEADKQTGEYAASFIKLYQKSVLAGTDDKTARASAKHQLESTLPDIGVAAVKYNFAGWQWGQGERAIPVEFGTNKYTPEEKANIQAHLAQAQSEQALGQKTFMRAANEPEKNPFIPDAKWIHEHAMLWTKEGTAWRLNVQEMQMLPDGKRAPTGRRQPVRVQEGGEGRYYDVQESDAKLPMKEEPSIPILGLRSSRHGGKL
jgi:hypothetical protein